MRVLFIHQNFPGQFLHVAKHLNQDARYEVVAMCQPYAPKIANIKTIQYKPARQVSVKTHHYNRPLESHTLNGQVVAQTLLKLKETGFYPDVVLAHMAWGEALYVKDIFPDTKLVGFFEFYYRAYGADVDFDPEFPQALNDVLRIRNKNATHLLSLEMVDAGVCSTKWQKSTHPKEFQNKLRFFHEGINTAVVKPDGAARYTLPNGEVLSKKDEVITYVARNLEPYRGFHILMRTLEVVCERRPNAKVLIVGGEEVSYGRQLSKGLTWRKKMLKEVKVDEDRVHFLGRLAYQDYLKVLQVSSVHVYLTVPFVLSWSMLEAMSAGCVVVASKTQPVTEVIKHGKNGLLVDFFSPLKIANNIDEVLNNPKQYRKIRRAARQTVLDGYTIDNGIKQYISLFEGLTNKEKVE